MIFPRIPRPTHPLLAALRNLGDGIGHVLRHVHELQETIVTTKQELLGQLGEVKSLAVETFKDVGRLVDKLDEALAAGNLDDVAAATGELRTLVQDVNDRVEAAAPEPPAEPEEPQPPAP